MRTCYTSQFASFSRHEWPRKVRQSGVHAQFAVPPAQSGKGRYAITHFARAQSGTSLRQAEVDANKKDSTYEIDRSGGEAGAPVQHLQGALLARYLPFCKFVDATRK
jgi:hypothetical protein